MKDLFEVPFHFPRQRPASATFAVWANGAGERVTRELLEQGLAALGASERARIPSEFVAAYPQVWEAISAEAGGRDAALEIMLAGAVVAGLEERHRELDRRALELLEVDVGAREDPVESLALVLVPGDLWSVLEVVDAVDSFDSGATVAAIAERLSSDWHEQRLDELVRRLRARLPVPGFPLASTAIENACRATRDDRRLRRSLRAELLLDALPTAVEAFVSRREPGEVRRSTGRAMSQRGLRLMLSGVTHGTITGYRYHGCRCARCRAAHSRSNADYQQTAKGRAYREAMRARGEPPPGVSHGYSGYVNHGCRCRTCCAAKADYAAARRKLGLS